MLNEMVTKFPHKSQHTIWLKFRVLTC